MGLNRKRIIEEDAKWRQYTKDTFDNTLKEMKGVEREAMLYITGPDFIASVAQLKDTTLIDDAIESVQKSVIRRYDMAQKMGIEFGGRAAWSQDDVVFILSHFDLLFRDTVMTSFEKKREGMFTRPTSRLSRAIYAMEANLNGDNVDNHSETSE